MGGGIVRRVLAGSGAVLAVAGIIEIAAAAGHAWVTTDRARNLVSTAVYTQNAAVDLSVDGTYPGERGHQIRYTMRNRYTERAIIAFDRGDAECVQLGPSPSRPLHVFTLVGTRELHAVGFIVEAAAQARRTRADHQIVCTFAHGFSGVAYHSLEVAGADGIAARMRLEYAAHPRLAVLPQARYPAWDPSLAPLSLERPR